MEWTEFEAGLAKRPELLDEIFEKRHDDAVKHLTEKKGKVVTTMDEYTSNTKKAVDLAVRQNHEGYESKIEKVSGIKKNAGESGHDYFDRVSANLKRLEDNNEENSPLYKGLKKELDDLKTERANEKKELAQAKIDGAVTGAVSKLTFAVPSHIKKDDEKSAYQRQSAEDATDIFNARYTAAFVDGKLVFTNKKGEAQTKDGEPMTADDIFKRDFAAKLQPTTHKQGGNGSGNDDTIIPDGGADFLGDTTQKIREKIAEMGVAFGTDKWQELYTKAHIAAGYTKTAEGYVKK